MDLSICDLRPILCVPCFVGIPSICTLSYVHLLSFSAFFPSLLIVVICTCLQPCMLDLTCVPSKVVHHNNATINDASDVTNPTIMLE
jgi:hypothetical protein